jgi:hypothetical protein
MAALRHWKKRSTRMSKAISIATIAFADGLTGQGFDGRF